MPVSRRNKPYLPYTYKEAAVVVVEKLSPFLQSVLSKYQPFLAIYQPYVPYTRKPTPQEGTSPLVVSKQAQFSNAIYNRIQPQFTKYTKYQELRTLPAIQPYYQQVPIRSRIQSYIPYTRKPTPQEGTYPLIVSKQAAPSRAIYNRIQPQFLRRIPFQETRVRSIIQPYHLQTYPHARIQPYIPYTHKPTPIVRSTRSLYVSSYLYPHLLIQPYIPYTQKPAPVIAERVLPPYRAYVSYAAYARQQPYVPYTHKPTPTVRSTRPLHVSSYLHPRTYLQSQPYLPYTRKPAPAPVFDRTWFIQYATPQPLSSIYARQQPYIPHTKKPAPTIRFIPHIQVSSSPSLYQYIARPHSYIPYTKKPSLRALPSVHPARGQQQHPVIQQRIQPYLSKGARLVIGRTKRLSVYVILPPRQVQQPYLPYTAKLAPVDNIFTKEVIQSSVHPVPYAVYNRIQPHFRFHVRDAPVVIVTGIAPPVGAQVI